MKIKTDIWKPARENADSPHYNIFTCHEDDGMDAIRQSFPDGEADPLNFILFSTSGVHGTGLSIEDVETENSPTRTLTFLIIQPRRVSMRYGNCIPQTPADFEFLKQLRKTSGLAAQTIGHPGI